MRGSALIPLLIYALDAKSAVDGEPRPWDALRFIRLLIKNNVEIPTERLRLIAPLLQRPTVKPRPTARTNSSTRLRVKSANSSRKSTKRGRPAARGGKNTRIG